MPLWMTGQLVKGAATLLVARSFQVEPIAPVAVRLKLWSGSRPKPVGCGAVVGAEATTAVVPFWLRVLFQARLAPRVGNWTEANWAAL